jgi:hypothetical protein
MVVPLAPAVLPVVVADPGVMVMKDSLQMQGGALLQPVPVAMRLQDRAEVMAGVVMPAVMPH